MPCDGRHDRRSSPGSDHPWVGCEGCHGPGGQHIEAMQGGNANNPHIFNPGHLPPGRDPQPSAAPAIGLQRRKRRSKLSMASRMFASRPIAWKAAAAMTPHRRTSCVACHNPHQMVERDVSSYDAKCITCHSTNVAAARHCPASKRDSWSLTHAQSLGARCTPSSPITGFASPGPMNLIQTERTCPAKLRRHSRL